MKRVIVVSIEVEISSAPCGCGDSTHQRQYFADAVAAVKQAVGGFYQCDTQDARLLGTQLNSEHQRLPL